MTIANLEKTRVEATWNLERIRETTARSFSHMMTSAMMAFNHAVDASKEFAKHETHARINYLKEHNVKTPIELVRALAEFESNVMGSKITITGDDHKATMDYETCACYNAMQKHGVKLTKEQEEKMFAVWETIRTGIAKEFGMKVEAKMGDPICTVTYTK